MKLKDANLIYSHQPETLTLCTLSRFNSAIPNLAYNKLSGLRSKHLHITFVDLQTSPTVTEFIVVVTKGSGDCSRRRARRRIDTRKDAVLLTCADILRLTGNMTRIAHHDDCYNY
jgi:hypothetical protein